MTPVHAHLTRDVIDPGAVLERVADDRHGAALLFLGVVRDHDGGRPVSGMRYDAYEAMAEDVLRTIAEEAAALADGGAVAVEHRVGELDIGEVSVAVAVGSAHRAPAYEASRHVIEEIKKRLPVWKKEHYADGASAWKDGQVPPVEEPA